MVDAEDQNMKEAVYEYAAFLYDLYIDASGNDTIIDGQNNAMQDSTS